MVSQWTGDSFSGLAQMACWEPLTTCQQTTLCCRVLMCSTILVLHPQARIISCESMYRPQWVVVGPCQRLVKLRIPHGGMNLPQPRVEPVLLDAWNNPIIFVPATGLTVRLLKGQNSNNPADPSQTFIVMSPEGQVQQYDSTKAGSPYVIKAGRPFWASAGPDGDFSKGDDNIYSFEQ